MSKRREQHLEMVSLTARRQALYDELRVTYRDLCRIQLRLNGNPTPDLRDEAIVTAGHADLILTDIGVIDDRLEQLHQPRAQA